MMPTWIGNDSLPGVAASEAIKACSAQLCVLRDVATGQALAATSLPALMRRLRKNWQYRHSLIYAAVLPGSMHFRWSVKSGWIEPGGLLGERAVSATTAPRAVDRRFKARTAAV